ncbi:unnamed protein product, partial [Prorocentrum cordatum]
AARAELGEAAPKLRRAEQGRGPVALSVGLGGGGAPPDGFADTPPDSPKPSRRDDPAGDGKGGGPWAPDRIASYTGKMPEHFSLLTALFGECSKDTCGAWDQPCTLGLILSSLLMAWTFKNLKVISDVYFVPSTIALARVLGMPSDVAGATLLAFGSSAPEFCTNVVATFFSGSATGGRQQPSTTCCWSLVSLAYSPCAR